ncbi:MAG: glycosyltransferase family 9 protein [Deltaproteobacteria bacterium]|nr:glycosyltransferase family 9 protein [Deltaproteobacteria bacterium]
MADAVLFQNGIGNFILTTPFLQNLNAPEIFMARDFESTASVRSISRWPVRDYEDAENVPARFDRVFVLWGWPVEKVVEGPNVIRQVKPKWRDDPRHEVKHYTDLLKESRQFPTVIETRWSWRPALGEGEKLVALVNGANPAWKNKLWPPEYWCDLARRLAARGDTQLVVLGGPSETAFGKAVTAAVGRRCWNFTGVWTFAQSAHFLTWCDLLVTNDTALMHVADVLARPVVAIWAWTLWHKNHPYNHEAHVVKSDGGGCPHFPCYGTPVMWTCDDAVCMKAISAQAVYDEVVRVL